MDFMCNRVVLVFCIVCFISCGFLETKNKTRLLQNLENIDLKSDWKDNLKLSNDELGILTFFVNALKDELSKAHISADHFNIHLKGDLSKVEGYVKRFFLKLNDKDKVRELLGYIKYGIDNPPNVEGRDVYVGMDAKEHYRLERRLASVFDNYFMLLNPPSSEPFADSSAKVPFIGGDPEDKMFNDIKSVCYEYRGSH
ncbi:hypothetical protein ACE4V3_06205 (plasmid) [Borrelia recurrentis]|uniref:Uncharacterized conserved protein n=1 Tax=Borrelia recurrentis (strain A1) TaxID=412418 RepID=B5RS47_BORRA|nr:hypothetical protein [Borrelia recurrentis]ACH95183.1 uncharacterized conserved protein [Borrelia recurrentis A1]